MVGIKIQLFLFWVEPTKISKLPILFINHCHIVWNVHEIVQLACNGEQWSCQITDFREKVKG